MTYNGKYKSRGFVSVSFMINRTVFNQSESSKLKKIILNDI